MKPLLSWFVRSSDGKSSRKGLQHRVVMRVEQLDPRIVPSATQTVWNPPAGHNLWSDATCWSQGLPDSTKIALFDGGQSNASCVFDTTVGAQNRTVAGLKFTGSYSGTLTLSSGFTLTVSSVLGDITTGFKMFSTCTSASIAPASANDTITITGGGGASYNFWNAGSIAGAVQSSIYVNGHSTLLISLSAGSGGSLGDNIIMGQDGDGGSTLEFSGQTQALSVTNNAGILITDTSSDVGPNQLMLDGDTSGVGTATQGMTQTNPDSFIDNYGIIIRRNPGTFDIGLPIKNESSSGQYSTRIDVQSPTDPAQPRSTLADSGSSPNKTAGFAIDQVGGNTIIENGSTLSVAGFFMNAGQLLTYGTTTATISAVSGFTGNALTVQGGTMEFSADNTNAYGSLTVNGSMSWTGGTFQDYINGGMAGQQSQLIVNGGSSSLNLGLGSGAHLSINVNGNLAGRTMWTPVTTTNGARIYQTLTLDNNTQFAIAYPPTPNYAITVTSN